MQVYKKIKALGTEIEFYLQSNISKDFNQDLLELELLINNFEKRFSRFLGDSELSLLNSADKAFAVSPELIKILLLAKDFYQITKGIFDPTILKRLENQGYDKSFDLLDLNQEKATTKNKAARINFSEVIIDLKNNLVTLPIGLKIDFGGIGKGYIVDVAVKILKNKGYKNFWISAGGDMYLSGVNDENKIYQVGVQNPKKLEENIFNINVIETEMAVATSGVAKRQWLNNGKKYNHIIDPRTGVSLANNLLAVTVISNQAIKADIYAKTILILGKDQGLDFINNQENAEALIIDENLEVSLSRNMNNYLTKI